MWSANDDSTSDCRGKSVWHGIKKATSVSYFACSFGAGIAAEQRERSRRGTEEALHSVGTLVRFSERFKKVGASVGLLSEVDFRKREHTAMRHGSG